MHHQLGLPRLRRWQTVLLLLEESNCQKLDVDVILVQVFVSEGSSVQEGSRSRSSSHQPIEIKQVKQDTKTLHMDLRDLYLYDTKTPQAMPEFSFKGPDSVYLVRITYNASASANEKGSQWEMAVKMLDEVHLAGGCLAVHAQVEFVEV